jgi:hypothetical protein
MDDHNYEIIPVIADAPDPSGGLDLTPLACNGP